MKSIVLTAALFLILSSTADAQKSIHISELEIDQELGDKDPEGNLMDGYWKLERDEGWYSLVHYTNGLLNGQYKTYKPDGTFKFESDYILGTQVYRLEYDENGDVLEREDFYTVEIIEGKRAKHGAYLDGKFKFVMSQRPIFNYVNKPGDYSIFEIKDGEILNGEEVAVYPDGSPVSKYLFEGNKILSLEVYKKNGEIMKSFTNVESFDLSKYPNSLRSAFQYSVDQVGPNQIRYKDASGNLLNGSYIFYKYASDSISTLSSFVNGLHQGLDYEFNDLGIVAAQRSYKEGKLHGTSYVQDGETLEISNHKGGVLDGLFMEFNFFKGIVTDSVNYSLGKEVGVQVKRFDNRATFTPYKNGSIHGRVETIGFMSTGEEFLQGEEFYQYGKRTGRHLTYDSTGTIIEESNYKFDKLHGKKMYYIESTRYEEEYKLGKSISSKEYKGDKLVSERQADGQRVTWTEYDENENIESKTLGFDLEYKYMEGDSVIHLEYGPSGDVVRKQVGIAPEDNMEIFNWEERYWEYLYDKKGRETKRFVEEDYPQRQIKIYEGDEVIKIITEPSYPGEGEKRTIEYVDPNGKVTKVCESTYKETDDYEGEWSKEKCN